MKELDQEPKYFYCSWCKRFIEIKNGRMEHDKAHHPKDCIKNEGGYKWIKPKLSKY